MAPSFETHPISYLGHLSGPTWFAILYNVFLAGTLAHWAWFTLARTLPVAVSSLSSLPVPVVGVFAGMLVLGERPGWSEFAALALVAVLAGCNDKRDPGFQGWVEADMIFVSPDETGRIEKQPVREGDRVVESLDDLVEYFVAASLISRYGAESGENALDKLGVAHDVPMQIAFALYPRFTALDIVGPFQTLAELAEGAAQSGLPAIAYAQA